MKRIGFVLVMMSLAGSVWADKQPIGDWFVTVQSKLSEAFTTNDSGSTFGFLCGTDSCSAYLDVNSECEAGDSYPMLINAESGSAYVSTTCKHFPLTNSVRYLAVIDDERIATAIATGSVIGFAIPLASGEFKVVRFSLNGAVSATDLAVSALKALKAKTFKDTTL